MERKTVYAGRIVNLGIESVKLPSGAEVDLEVIRHPGAAAVVPVHADGSVTLIHQFRHAAGGMIWEVPAGVLEGDEPPVDCAKRELAEEVQLVATHMDPLGCIRTTPGFTDEKIHIFLATGLSETTETGPEDDEYIHVRRVPMATALEWVRRGVIVDGKTICALHLAAAVQQSQG